MRSTKNYLLISPQPWGKMFLSKHNYAIELAKGGNTVYFLNPPTYKKSLASISIKVEQELPNVYVINYTLAMAVHIMRFKSRPAYDFIIRKSLISRLNGLAAFDEIWCFEPNIFSSFRPFAAKKKLLFLVDQYDNKTLKKLAESADGIATISTLILDFFNFTDKPKLLLNHGLNDTFASLAKAKLTNGFTSGVNQPVKAAYVGNLLQGNRVDYETLQTIITQNSNVEFHFYGPYEEKDNTLGSTLSAGMQSFIEFLKVSGNVKLHGVIAQQQMAAQMHSVDVFLTCYNYLTDYNRSSNCHKIIEYLSTGKAVVANRIMTYEKTTGLLEMPAEFTNENLPSLFRKVVESLDRFNSPDKQKARMEFALENTYKKHIATISRFINEPVVVA
ncbi:MAG TPA: hypothetical protein VM884_00870 [Flavisolibacter sp.]|nr:hypothetical protein [Flavisolibacter sp.]